MRVLCTAATLAVLALGPAAVAAEPDPQAEQWVRAAERRFDRVLEDPPAETPAPELRVGEAALDVAPNGVVTGWRLTRSTGFAGADKVLAEAADALRLPPPPPAVAGRPIVLRLAVVGPTPVGKPWRATEKRPTVAIEAAEAGPAPVVIAAVR